MTTQKYSTIGTLLGLDLDPLVTQSVLTLPTEYEMTADGLTQLEIQAIELTQQSLFGDQAYDDSKHSVCKLSGAEQVPFIQASILKQSVIQPVKDGSGKVIGLNYDDDVFNQIDAATGNYTAEFVRGMDPNTGQRHKYVSYEERRKYLVILTSDEYFRCRLSSERAIHAAANAHGLLVRPLAANTPEDYDEWFYIRNPGVRNGKRFIDGFQNSSIVSAARDANGNIILSEDGTGRHVNPINIVQWLKENYATQASPEKAFVEGVIDFGMGNLLHSVRGERPFEKTYADTQVPGNPTATEYFLYVVGGSGTNVNFFSTLFEAGGYKSIYTLSGDFGLEKRNRNLIAVVINNILFYGEGNDFFKRVFNHIEACQTLTSDVMEIDRISLEETERYTPTFCNMER